jgi:hypothetical protein
MRRFSFVLVVTALLIAGSAAPARAQELTQELNQQLSGGTLEQQLSGGQPVFPAATGKLVDVACYTLIGASRVEELQKCQETSAAKGQRLAILTAFGLYYLKGPFTENGNKALLPLLDHPVQAFGTVTLQDAALVLAPAPDPAGDTRRKPNRTGEVKFDKTRRNDYREGDPRTGMMNVIELTSIVDLLAK